MVEFTEKLITAIYDCAADPDCWPIALSHIRDRFDGAYCLIGFADFSSPIAGKPASGIRAQNINIHSPWDPEYIRKASEYFNEYPGAENFILKDGDQSWSQMSVIAEVDFRQTAFYQKFCKPQGLRDCLNAIVIKRPELMSGLAVTRSDPTKLFDSDDMKFVETLTPHLRRALAINDIADKGRLATALFRNMLDKLATAVFLIGHANKIEFLNAAAENIVRDGQILLAKGGVLSGTRPESSKALQNALEKAAKGDAALGLAGIGVPLIGKDDSRAAAYVLPMGASEIRNGLGRGHCAVFLAQRNEQLPVMAEIMRTLFDLTPTEAKIASLISKGDKPSEIAESMQLSINTIRTHLARTFSKTNTLDQAGLSQLMQQMSPPVSA